MANHTSSQNAENHALHVLHANAVAAGFATPRDGTRDCPTPPAAYAATVIASTYGVSRQQRPLVDYRIADATKKVLIVGGIHAGTEANTVSLVQDLFTAAQADPTLAPSGLSLTFLVSANADGHANDTRTFASGVDPNRNWPTDDWATDSYVSGPTLVPGGGGPYPLSEPETRALAQFVMNLRPDLIVSYHSAAELVTGGPRARALGLEAVYANTAGYAAGNWTAYPGDRRLRAVGGVETADSDDRDRTS